MLPEFFVILLFSYVIGSISSAIIVCRVFNLPDPRSTGSNNPGATNVLRIGGKKIAAIVLLGDAVKGAVPVLLARYFEFELLSLTIIAMGAFLGHVYPIFFKFQGGKGIATFLGALLALNYLVGIGFIVTWLFVAKVLKVSSLSALIATLLTPVYFYLITENINATYVIIIICVYVFFTHRSNIKRIMSGEEKSIPSKK